MPATPLQFKAVRLAQAKLERDLAKGECAHDNHDGYHTKRCVEAEQRVRSIEAEP